MPDNQVVQLKDTTTGQVHSVPLSEMADALKSGKYEEYNGSIVNTDRLGTVTRVEPSNALGVINAGEGYINPNVIGAEQAIQQQRDAFNNMGDKALTFAEGVVDAASVGLIHEPGDDADVRRDVNSGSALAGQLVGTFAGFETGGPIRFASESGEALGKAASKWMFKDAENSLAKFGSKALTEAGSNAALMAAGSTGHQLTDAMFADKPIAVEAIAHEAGMGALLGGSAALMGEGFSHVLKSSRAAAEAGAGVPEFINKAGTNFDGIAGDLHEAVKTHAARLEVLDGAAKEGLIPSEFIEARRTALNEAKKAADTLDKLGSAEGALNGTAKEARKYQEALEDYNTKVGELDKVMQPKIKELGLREQQLGTPEQGPVRPTGDDVAPGGVTNEGVQYGNNVMNNSPWGKAQYEKLFGKPWQEIAPSNGAGSVEVSTGEQNLGGKNTPTSGDRTQINKPTPKPADKPIEPSEVMPSGAKSNAEAFHEAFDKHFANPDPVMDLRKVAMNDANLKHGFEPRVGAITPEEFGSIHQEAIGTSEPNPAYRTEEKYIERGKQGRAGNLSDQERANFNNDAQKVGTEITLDKHERFKKLMDDWFNDSKTIIRGTPGTKVASDIENKMADLNTQTNGRMDAAGSLELAKQHGFNKPQGLLGERFQQAWAVKKSTSVAADATRGTNKGDLLDLLKNRIGGRIGRIAGGAIAGGYVGGDAGSALGVALAAGYSSFSGKVAGSIARISDAVAKASESLLSRRSVAVTSKAVSANNAWSYSDKGPIKDPIQRIMEIQHIAAHPELIEQRLYKSAEDLSVVHPEMHDLLTKVIEHRITALSVRAPKFMWDKWGNALPPAAGELRRFLEYENALNDLQGTLKAVQSGNVTKDQADGLRDGWPAWHMKLSTQLLGDKDSLQKLPAEKLQAIGFITGAPLDNTSDGAYVERQQSSWAIANQQSEANKPTQKPQAFKINSNKVPAAHGTVNQSINGRAPGN
jgi:hypothetical protein